MIKTNEDEFYIEPARNYLNRDRLKDDEDYRNKTKDIHSIIYKLSDLKFPNSTCKHHFYENEKHHHLHKRQTTNDLSIKSLPYSNSSIEPDQLNNKYLQTVRKNSITTGGEKSIKKSNKTQSSNKNRKSFYWTRDLDALHYVPHNSKAYGVRAIQRTHGWTSDIEQQSHLVVDSRKSTCMLYLQADHLVIN